MRKVLSLVLVAVFCFACVSCGSSQASWNESEEKIYGEFLGLQNQVQAKMDDLTSNEPETYQDAKKIAAFVWEWKNYENSCISDVYKNWRTSAGEAVETKAMLHFYKENDPNYVNVKSERDFAEQVWIYDTKQVLETVEKLKK
ncbi:MAG: hypothetical protein R2883_03715 [Caldisericia bacterium]